MRDGIPSPVAHRNPWQALLAGALWCIPALGCSGGDGPVAPDAPSDDRILFASDRDGDSDVYLMGSDGTGLVQLTNDPAGDNLPDWLGAGRDAIVFESNRSGFLSIHRMSVEGTGVVHLTPNAAGQHPAASADGQRIALVRGNDIHVVNADGTAQNALTNQIGRNLRPSWCGSDRIVFQSDRHGDWELYVMNPDGSGLTRLTVEGSSDVQPACSPDGTRIAFQSTRDGDDEIYVMNADGSAVTQLTSNNAFDGAPAWSADGTRIAFETNRDGNFEIYVMAANGTEQTNLTRDPARDISPDWF